MIHTVESIREKVKTDPKWAIKALLTIYEKQTEDERVNEQTVHNNGVGFNGIDSQIMTSFAKQLLRNKNMSERQMEIIFKVMPKYAGQLYRIAELKEQNNLEVADDRAKVINQSA